MDCAIVLVAAGASTRMGFPKLWADVCGQPLLAHAVASAHAASPAELVLVVSEDRLAAARTRGPWRRPPPRLGHQRPGRLDGRVAGHPRRRPRARPARAVRPRPPS